MLACLTATTIKTTATPNQLLLAKSLGQEVNDDMVAQNGQFEHDWYDRGEKSTLDRDDIEFGEINNHYIHDEFDATIVEVAFHDNNEDAELMRDPEVRDAIARATYKGLINVFPRSGRQQNAGHRVAAAGDRTCTPNRSKPGSVTISWVPPTANPYAGDAASGIAFMLRRMVTGSMAARRSKAEHSTVTPKSYAGSEDSVLLQSGGRERRRRVAGVGGRGGLAERRRKAGLVVNGFDRLDRTMDPKQNVEWQDS